MGVINPWFRKIRIFFAGPDRNFCQDALARQRQCWERACLQLRFFYGALLYLAAGRIAHWSVETARAVADPLWPVLWLRWVKDSCGIGAILILHLVGALCAVGFPQKFWARALAFLGLLEYGAFNNSFGKIGHSEHGWILAGFVLMFLPARTNGSREPEARKNRQVFLHIFWTAQASVLLTYSMAGWSKIGGALLQCVRGEPSLFSFDALSRHIAARLLETGVNSAWGPWLIAHPWVGWPALWGVVYVQAFSFWAAFRPRLRAVWALLLVLFHLASFFAMDIFFAQAILLLSVLYLPEGQDGVFPKRWERLLPVVGDLLWSWQGLRREAPVRVRSR
ncbi:hypothetical protein [Candidatus Methylacidithermus pantelleriae]|uniref:HTTM domain-containing protein n=1 Tax=Candidatus Methylacidithermus pantelleriae TaxID=2744239 RepID=A0A8J2BK64_9BACT|nr:hypothetical protein [Candidatus Methylacidithermus pantelleriae]CAF0692025.1 conserved membrane hypothetical protein [Candidatus Methylacidithermus pantelleriae]